MTRILLLGGTSEASAMARLLAQAGIEAQFSYAGRTAAPVAQPLPTRIGGFGGPEGLARHLREGGFTHLIDATHPFAAQISTNAVHAADISGVPLLVLQRPEWRAGAGDDWCHVRDVEQAAQALPRQRASVFLAIGKQNLAAFAGLPHRFLLRLVDEPTALPLPDAQVVVARGPFTAQGDTRLMRDHAITHLVAKNAGGSGAEAKLTAARELGLRVIMIDRPAMPERQVVDSAELAMAWLHQTAPRGV
ncbi:cobalt-precorrin-6A reductase [Paracoccus sediminilitoris]|uniref:cobalt-precorrin-6A reductase n=1 Tax=Paracoccus sediminilitoris TaxID=2202419 RepID=UPI000DBA0A13|nr:cobalt-precorrin-6A reductase [Paracoccus sediminilitoris]